MTRMINDYINRFYCKEGKRSAELKANNYAKAKEIVAWKENVASKWNDIHAVDIQVSDALKTTAVNGDEFEATVVLYTAGLGKDLGVELVVYSDADRDSKLVDRIPLAITKTEGDNLTYYVKDKIKYAGSFRYAFRVYPNNSDLPHRQDFAYVKWL